MPKFLNAYTTLEILIVIGVMILITGMVIPVSMRQTKLNELSIAGKDLHSNMFLQQQNAFAGKNNIEHGVYIQNDGYWVFEGEDFENSSKKDFFSFGKGIVSTSGIKEIIFEQNSQKPNSPQTIILNYSGYNYSVVINHEGIIDSYVQ